MHCITFGNKSHAKECISDCKRVIFTRWNRTRRERYDAGVVHYARSREGVISYLSYQDPRSINTHFQLLRLATQLLKALRFADRLP